MAALPLKNLRYWYFCGIQKRCAEDIVRTFLKLRVLFVYVILRSEVLVLMFLQCKDRE